MKQIRQVVITMFIVNLACLTLLFSGCASGPEFKPITDIPSNKALVYVYRKGRILGAANESHIFVNGEYLTKLKNSAYAPRVVEPGKVVFSTLRRLNAAMLGGAVLASLEKEKNMRLTISVEAGNTYYVQWLVGNKMILMDESTGAKEIKGLKLSELTSQ